MTDVVLLQDDSTAVVLSNDDLRVVSLDSERVIVSVGEQGPPGRAGNESIGGFGVATSNLQQGDHLEFSGAAWVNSHKSTLTDGGNF